MYCAEQVELEMLFQKSKIEESLVLAYHTLSNRMCTVQGLDKYNANFILKITFDSAPTLVSMCNVTNKEVYFEKIYQKDKKIECDESFSVLM